MTKNKPSVPKMPVPIIGEKDKETKALINESIKTILAKLDPIMQNILQNIDGLERRVAVVEEVKQVFPSRVDVHLHQALTTTDGSTTGKEKK